MMFREMMHMGRREPGDPIQLLMLSSLFREDMPWLYEMAMEVYRTSKAGLAEEASRARRDLHRALEFCLHGPGAEEMGIDPEAHHMLMRELEHSLLQEPVAEEQAKERPKRKKDEKESA